MTGYYWTAERTAKLKELYLARQTYTKIGLALGVSRNSASGRVMRMIAAGDLPKIHAPVIEFSRTPKPKAFIFGDGPKAREKQPPKPIEPPAPVLQPLRISLLKLSDRQCKFAVSDGPNYEFCGLPVESGSWCKDHHRVVLVPNAPRKAA